MEVLFVSFLILILTFLNSLNFIAGVLAAQAGEVFLGTVHWPGDYFYYLSQFAQGKESWFAGYDFYSSDFTQKTYVGWVNVFLGHLFHLVGVSQIYAYQISVVLFTVALLLVSYLFIREIFPEEKLKRIAAFFIFALGNAAPRLIFENGKWTWSYFDFWFNNGVPFNRFGSVPHQLIGRVAVIGVFLLAVWWFGGRRSLWLLLVLIITSVTLVSVEPVHWILVSLVLFLTPIIFYGFLRRFHDLAHTGCVQHTPGVCIFGIFFLSGLPMVLYLQKLFQFPPYSQLRIWEAQQQLNVDIIRLALGYGPGAFLAILGVPLFFKKISAARFIAVFFTAVSFFIFFSPLPSRAGIVNVRFLPAAIMLFLSCLSAEALILGCKRIAPQGCKRIAISAIALFTVLTLPAYRIQLSERIKTDKINAYYFVPQSVVETYREAEKISTQRDNFLVIWPFNVSFPAIAARRVYEGHHLLTIKGQEKDKLQSEFFEGKMSEDEMSEFLAINKIDYILAYPWNQAVNNKDLFEKVFTNDYLGVYKTAVE